MPQKNGRTLSFMIEEKRVKKATSIGKSARSRPSNKHQKRSFKKYRGQG